MPIALRNIEIPDGTRQLDVTASSQHTSFAFRGDNWTACVEGIGHQWAWRVLVFRDEVKPMDGEVGVNVPIAFTGGNTNQRSTALANIVDSLAEILADPPGEDQDDIPKWLEDPIPLPHLPEGVKLSRSEERVYRVIRQMLGEDNHDEWRPISTTNLARITEYAPGTVSLATRALCDIGLLERDIRKGRATRFRLAVYEILDWVPVNES